MEVKRVEVKPEFVPVTITLETPEEVAVLKAIAWHTLTVPDVVATGHISFNSVKDFLVTLNKKLSEVV